eukprot:SAG11_NODE_2542_length_3237_cov_1.924841_3_plen_91_part_00
MMGGGGAPRDEDGSVLNLNTEARIAPVGWAARRRDALVRLRLVCLHRWKRRGSKCRGQMMTIVTDAESCPSVFQGRRCSVWTPVRPRWTA